MTNWAREYRVRLFGWNGQPWKEGIDCDLRGCTVEVSVFSRQSGPYAVRVTHNGIASGDVVEDEYRESTALDDLIAEWIEHEHKMACICDDGGVVWCPQHGDLWYDYEGRQYRVEVVGQPTPGQASSPEELAERWERPA